MYQLREPGEENLGILPLLAVAAVSAAASYMSSSKSASAAKKAASEQAAAMEEVARIQADVEKRKLHEQVVATRLQAAESSTRGTLRWLGFGLGGLVLAGAVTFWIVNRRRANPRRRSRRRRAR